MHNKFSWLQLFADGTGDGGAATSGETSAAAGQNTGVNVSVAAEQTAPKTTADRLAELGVPKEKLGRAKYGKAVNQPKADAQAAAAPYRAASAHTPFCTPARARAEPPRHRPAPYRGLPAPS